MGNIVSYFRAKPGQAGAVEQTKLAREITDDTREKKDERVIIHQQEVTEEPTPSINEDEETNLEEVEDAEETFDDLDVIQDGKAQNEEAKNLTGKFNKGVDIVETDTSATEKIYNQNKNLNHCEEESYLETSPESTVEITENSVTEDSGIFAPILQTGAEDVAIITKFEQNAQHEEDKQESREEPAPANNEGEETKLEEVEKARETFNVIQDGKAQNLTDKFNEGVNIVETENSATEKISKLNKPLNHCEEEAFIEPSPEVIVIIEENSHHEEDKQESPEQPAPPTDLIVEKKLETFDDFEVIQEDKHQNLDVENKAANVLENHNSEEEEITILTEEAIVDVIGTIEDNILKMKEDNVKPLPPAHPSQYGSTNDKEIVSQNKTQANVEQGKQLSETMNVENIEAIAAFIEEPGVGSEGDYVNDLEIEDSHSKDELVTNVFSLNQSPETFSGEDVNVIAAEDDLMMKDSLSKVAAEINDVLFKQSPETRDVKLIAQLIDESSLEPVEDLYEDLLMQDCHSQVEVEANSMLPENTNLKVVEVMKELCVGTEEDDSEKLESFKSSDKVSVDKMVRLESGQEPILFKEKDESSASEAAKDEVGKIGSMEDLEPDFIGQDNENYEPKSKETKADMITVSPENIANTSVKTTPELGLTDAEIISSVENVNVNNDTFTINTVIDSDIGDEDGITNEYETDREGYEDNKACPAGAAGLKDILEDSASSERQ